MESVILVPSIIYLCHPGLGICICKFGGGGKRRTFSVLGPGSVMGGGGGDGRAGEDGREEPVQLFRVSARLSATPVAPREGPAGTAGALPAGPACSTSDFLHQEA